MAASSTSPDQGFNGSKNLQRKPHFLGVAKVLGMRIQDFLPEVYLLGSFTLSKGRNSNKF